MEEKLISSENLSTQVIKSLFDNAFIDTGFDKEDLFIKERWRTWVYVDKGNRYFSLNLYFTANQSAKMADRIEYATRINDEFILVKVIPEQNVITFRTYVWVEGGVTPKNIIHVYKAFIMVIEQALEEDKAGVLA